MFPLIAAIKAQRSAFQSLSFMQFRHEADFDINGISPPHAIFSLKVKATRQRAKVPFVIIETITCPAIQDGIIPFNSYDLATIMRLLDLEVAKQPMFGFKGPPCCVIWGQMYEDSRV